jgi:hypothetical protein
MNYLNLFSYDDIPKDWKEGEDCWEGCFEIYDKEGNMVDFESIGEIAHTSSAFVGMSYDDYFVAPIY